jgi:hypothetical protein
MTLTASLPAALTAPSRQFFALWDGWRRGRLLPHRRDIDTAALGALLPYCFLLEIRSHDRMPICFAGSAIHAILGEELTGRNYLDLTEPQNRARRAALLLAEAAQPCAAVIYYWLRDETGGLLPVELVSAPLLADTATEGSASATLILACASPLMRGSAPDDVIPDSYAEGEGLRYIDIGAGIPPLTGSMPLQAQQVQ